MIKRLKKYLTNLSNPISDEIDIEDKKTNLSTKNYLNKKDIKEIYDNRLLKFGSEISQIRSIISKHYFIPKHNTKKCDNDIYIIEIKLLRTLNEGLIGFCNNCGSKRSFDFINETLKINMEDVIRKESEDEIENHYFEIISNSENKYVRNLVLAEIKKARKNISNYDIRPLKNIEKLNAISENKKWLRKYIKLNYSIFNCNTCDSKSFYITKLNNNMGIQLQCSSCNNKRWVKGNLGKISEDDSKFKSILKSKILREELIIKSNTEIPKNNYKREAIPQEVKDTVWRRDEGKCVKCGSSELLEYDHDIPVSKGGANTYRNLRLLCQPCNRRKGAQIG